MYIRYKHKYLLCSLIPQVKFVLLLISIFLEEKIIIMKNIRSSHMLTNIFTYSQILCHKIIK